MMDQVMSVTRKDHVRPPVRVALCLAVVTALVGTGLVALLWSGDDTDDHAARTTSGAAPDVPLVKDKGSVVRAATVPLARGRGLVADARGRHLTQRLTTDAYKMVAVTWASGRPEVDVRFRNARGWSEWTHLEALTDGPTVGDAESRQATRRGTELLWVGRSDGVQVRTTATTGLDLVLIDPGALAADATATPAASATQGPGAATATTVARTTSAGTTSAAARPNKAPRPPLYDRSVWKPNPDYLNGSPVYTNIIKQVHVHHTASANTYSRADVPAILRGMYRYHTQTLGWFDIGYNFLVDRFGRSWIGRSGGARKRVRGAHTLGFNHNSVGIAVIGNYESRNPTTYAVTAIVRLAAWKLDLDGQHATGRTWMYSKGSDKYPAGRRVALYRIDGHRDTNDTACPGARLYRLLPDIRTRAERRLRYYS